MMKNIKIKEKIYLVGKIDDRDVPFHRLTLRKGTTYNSYLLLTEKPTIIDTVDISFGREYVESLKTLIDLEKIQYIVINHTEPDHSGALGTLAYNAKNAIIVCSKKAVDQLKAMYKLYNRTFLVVKDGDTLDIGGKTLEFIETPYLHTEETMITFAKEDRILFPCDIFSTHVANYEYFNDKAKEDILEDFKIYYSLIMHPHRRYVQNMIKKIRNLDIEIIAPSHGFILREDAEKFIKLYDEMSGNTNADKKVLILYSTMTNNTKKISELIKGYFEKDNINVELIDVNKASDEDILKNVKEADAVFVGTSTKYADMIGKLEDVLKSLKNIDLENKIAAAFGSYGWSGEGIEVLQDYLNETNMKTLSTSYIIKSTGMTDVKFPIRIKFSPEEMDKEEIKKATTFIADLLLNSL
ncbi:metallo-beta-lactamase superfamily protein [Clostridium argentinense CDC 2741]|uniref:Metallo-beta-lactamase superfamily protein n=1 Tax=Clostridium argentinense CDC 2741 TaxID=1418104 RepID=A0A0C1QZY9_9CLOT|nr:FprA family A-type flavoprotein [Clostridium argentinense]ARC86516.1 FprA family A-type flavoprotein [Clostridium argentinense]KIE46682.1 metallo-beta-lactamase superfamily protein [Clostridium argentinense CDC 2741]NFF37981.1 FprA family A-type flavoprotein [Clostridium argentinense]NFP49963.1 FprA family A-type flavoprotein [Clostridium argentinense]NFP71373.1 FprA family A-type flavoprotein [Clostridium argentinense]